MASADAAPIQMATVPFTPRRRLERQAGPTRAVRTADCAGDSPGLARTLAATMCRVDATASVDRNRVAPKNVERFANVAVGRRIGVEQPAAATTQADGTSTSGGDRPGQHLRLAALAAPGRCASARSTGDAAMHDVLAGLQAPGISRVDAFASSHHSRELALALHRAAAGRPRAADPRCTHRRGGARLRIGF
jgi:hypothetical protein